MMKQSNHQEWIASISIFINDKLVSLSKYGYM